MLLKKLYIIMLICITLLSGNIAKDEHTESQPQGTSVKYNNTEKIPPSAKIIYDYVEYLNNKDYDKALSTLGGALYEALADSDYKYFKNIEHMEIKTLIDKTDKAKGGVWLPNPREFESVYELKVFYCEIEYKTNNTVQSYLRDGINYVKIITIKESNDSPWKLAEMSAAEKSWKED